MDDAFVTVGCFHRLDDANFAKSLLDGAGIPAVLVGDHTVGIAWHLSPALGGVQLRVRKLDEALARAILNPPADARSAAAAPGRSNEEPDPEPDDPDSERSLGSDADDDADMAAPDPRLLAESEAEDEARSRLTPREELAQRAFRAAVIGTVLPPVQIYATWLILRVLFARGPMQPRYWFRTLIAVLVNAAAWTIAFTIVESAHGGPIHIGAGCTDLTLNL